jgi:glycosyltransferase involved in cell wall biosynthesis
MYQVTVGICCYKQKKWLYRCLRSLASQTLNKDLFEVVIINDDPLERLEDVCEPIRDYLNIKLINNTKNLGLSSSLNKILRQAKGRYFVRVDSDDFVSKHFLYMLSTYLFISRRTQAVACDYKKVNEVGENINVHCSAEKDFIACGIMFTYESLCDLNFYNEKFEMKEGHELIARFREKYQLDFLKVPLYRYRIHLENRTKNKKKLKKYNSLLNKND